MQRHDLQRVHQMARNTHDGFIVMGLALALACIYPTVTIVRVLS
jgi:hypothetical protein